MPDERSEPLGVEWGATVSLSRNSLQQPGAIRADLGSIGLDQALQLAAGGKFIEINVNRDVRVCESAHVEELMIARSPEAAIAAHSVHRGEPGGPLCLCQLLGRRNHELRASRLSTVDAVRSNGSFWAA